MPKTLKFLIGNALRTCRLLRCLAAGTITGLSVVAALGSLAHAQGPGTASDLAVRPEFREPAVLASKDGVLEVRLTARQGQATLDTVATPVKSFLLFKYEVIRGTSSDGRMS